MKSLIFFSKQPYFSLAHIPQSVGKVPLWLINVDLFDLITAELSFWFYYMSETLC